MLSLTEYDLNILHGLELDIDDLNTKVGNLSGGMKTRLFLARVLYSSSDLLLLDEPTNHLDLTSKNQLLSALQKYEGAMIIISRDEKFLENLHINRMLLLPEQSWFYMN